MKQQYKTYLKYALLAALIGLGIYLTVLVIQKSQKEKACIPEKGWEKLCPGDWGCCSVKGKANEAVDEAYTLAKKWEGYANGLDDTKLFVFAHSGLDYGTKKYGKEGEKAAALLRDRMQKGRGVWSKERMVSVCTDGVCTQMRSGSDE